MKPQDHIVVGGIKETTDFFHGRLHDDLFGQICSQAPLELTVLLSFSRLESPSRKWKTRAFDFATTVSLFENI